MHWLCAGNKAAEELVGVLSRLLSYGDVRLAFSRSTSPAGVSAWLNDKGFVRAVLINDLLHMFLDAGVAAAA